MIKSPLMFYMIKNDIVTPYVLGDDDQLKTTVLPLKFYLMMANKNDRTLMF